MTKTDQQAALYGTHQAAIAHLQVLVVGDDLDDAVPNRSADEITGQGDHLQHLVHIP